MIKIFCVEDDESIRELVVYALENSGFASSGFNDSVNFFQALEEESPDLILLDIMLPDDDGYSILKQLKANPSSKDIPVIMLTAKNTEYDKVKGLDLGADDYISKPFGVMELISRVKAVLRRTLDTVKDENIYILKELHLDNDKRIVKVDDVEVNLTYKEFELLLYLLRNEGNVLTRDMIMNEVWGSDFLGESRTVDVHIRTLRMKLANAGRMIETIRNVGYKIGG